MNAWLGAAGVLLRQLSGPAGRRLRGEAAWLMLGHVGIAAGGLVAVRIMTTVLDPAQYGALTLLMGVAALATALAMNPLMQAAMRFLPEARATGAVHEMHRVLRRWQGVVLLAAALVLSLGGLLLGDRFGVPPFVGALVALLLAVDTVRNYETSLLNAAQRQRPMMAWRTAEAWARPFGALAAILVLGAGAWQALLGYALAAGAVNLLMYRLIVLEGREPPPGPDDGSGPKRDASPPIVARIGRYALPLAPMGAVGWINGTSDRYVIAAVLSLADAGLFAAVYAITSRPFLALRAFLDALFRPRLYEAASQGREAGLRGTLAMWLSVALGIGGGFVLLVVLFDEFIAQLLLGERFRDGTKLMGWIALGYLFGLVQAPFARILHAHMMTRHILVIQIVTAVVGLTSTICGIWALGVLGAAAAVAFYFGVRLMLTVALALRAGTDGNQMRPSPDTPQ